MTPAQYQRSAVFSQFTKRAIRTDICLTAIENERQGFRPVDSTVHATSCCGYTQKQQLHLIHKTRT